MIILTRLSEKYNKNSKTNKKYNLKAYEKFIRDIKEYWGTNVTDVEVFLSSIDGIHKRYDVSGPVIHQLKKKK
ncbi:hypothetical protein GF327_07435 [Candidatus Woesearchaeota archaeon]|nr:hypothetical protein [Candidatus Woesearchaeota archaeon]